MGCEWQKSCFQLFSVVAPFPLYPLSLPFLSLPLHLFSSPHLPLEVRPKIQLGSLAERCKLPQCAGAAQQLWRWGVQIRERSERKFFFDPPTFDLPGGDMKQDIAVFFTAIMTSDL